MAGTEVLWRKGKPSTALFQRMLLQGRAASTAIGAHQQLECGLLTSLLGQLLELALVAENVAAVDGLLGGRMLNYDAQQCV